METLGVVEARKSFSEIMARVAFSGERVVIERNGRPMVALISIEDLRRFEGMEQEIGSARARRAAALAAAAAAREHIRMERGSVPLPDAAETLARLREERSDEPADLC